ncbi:MAG TPA: ABC transporter permease [Caldilineaceae bacterium]|nr:ABC transporter permease [Caldilineaceae bacterium]
MPATSTAKLSLRDRDATETAGGLRRQESLAAAVWRAFLRHRSGMIGLALTLLILALSLAAPLLTPYDPLVMHSEDRFAPPSAAYPMGADEFGRDIFSRLLYGGRVAFGVGGLSIALATVVGVALGAVAGYESGWFDAVSMRFFDALLAFPAILLAIVILAVLGPGAINAALAVAIVNIPVFARLARANVLAEKHKEYVSASRAIGASPLRVLFRGILPNSLATIIVQVTVSFASAVLLESSLSFLGLGVPLPAPSWGSMLSIGRGYMNQAPWYSIFPGLAIMLLVLGVYLLGDGLRDVLDPRRQKVI